MFNLRKILGYLIDFLLLVIVINPIGLIILKIMNLFEEDTIIYYLIPFVIIASVTLIAFEKIFKNKNSFGKK